jgi:hypothetical protein
MPTVGISGIQVRQIVAAARGVSPFTLEEEIQVHQGQLWRFGVSFAAMQRDDAEEWVSFFSQLNGPQGSFLFSPRHAIAPRGAATGAPAVDGAGQTGLTLATTGWTVSTANILRKGDFISIGSSSSTRLYKVALDADSDSSGNALLDIWPRLRESPADAAAITTASPMGVFRLDGNEMAHDIDAALIYGGLDFTCREAW